MASLWNRILLTRHIPPLQLLQPGLNGGLQNLEGLIARETLEGKLHRQGGESEDV